MFAALAAAAAAAKLRRGGKGDPVRRAMSTLDSRAGGVEANIACACCRCCGGVRLRARPLRAGLLGAGLRRGGLRARGAGGSQSMAAFRVGVQLAVDELICGVRLRVRGESARSARSSQLPASPAVASPTAVSPVAVLAAAPPWTRPQRKTSPTELSPPTDFMAAVSPGAIASPATLPAATLPSVVKPAAGLQ